jgi:putative DNA primase/helicase
MDARAITLALSGQWQGSYGLCCCPSHDDGKPSLKVKDDPRKIEGVDVYCFGGCDWRDVKTALSRLGLIPEIGNGSSGWPHTAGTTSPPPKKDSLLRVSNIWRSSLPLTGTLGGDYLEQVRGLPIGDLGDVSHAIRFQKDMQAVISLMTDPVTNTITGVQRTFLNNDGTKRERMMLGSWGVVRISPDEDVTHGLGICEGVEDGIATLLRGWSPMWATCCAGMMAKLPVLSGIENLTIFYDRDKSGAGLAAAEECAARWYTAGREVVLR